MEQSILERWRDLHAAACQLQDSALVLLADTEASESRRALLGTRVLLAESLRNVVILAGNAHSEVNRASPP